MFELLHLGVLGAVVGSGLMSGLFFVFSNFAMKAFKKLDPSAGIAAMQQINIIIINPLFMITFFGTALISIALVIYGVMNWSEPVSLWLVIGGVAYVVGCILVTMMFNVPLNNRLAAVDPTTEAGRTMWDEYHAKWVPWNHVRTIATIVATISFAIGLGYLL